MLGLLESIIRTLNKIEVRGEENIDMMLGCIQTLKKLKDACVVKEETVDVTENQQGAQV